MKRRRRNPDEWDMPEPTAEDLAQAARIKARYAPIREQNRREEERRTSVGQVAIQALSRYGEMRRRRETTAERYTLKQILQQSVEYAVEQVFGSRPPAGMNQKVYDEAARLLSIGGVRVNPRRRNPSRKSNPFKRRRPTEWDHMTRAQRSAWNKANWVPDQYVADKGLARDDRRIAKRHEAAKIVQDRGVGIQALARLIGMEVTEEEQEAYEARKSNPKRSTKRSTSRRGKWSKSRSEVDTLSRIFSKAGIRHVVAKSRSSGRRKSRSSGRRKSRSKARSRNRRSR